MKTFEFYVEMKVCFAGVNDFETEEEAKEWMYERADIAVGTLDFDVVSTDWLFSEVTERHPTIIRVTE